MRRPRVLFVAPVEPWCRENGSSLIIADLLAGLEAVASVDLLPIFVRRPPAGYARQAPVGLEGELLDIPGLPRWVSIAGAALRGSTPLRMRFDNSRVAKAIERTLQAREFRPDLVHVEHLPLVDIGAKVAGARGVSLVYRAHNVESQLWRRRLEGTGPVGRAFVHRMEREEAAAAGEAQLTLCISEGDLDWVRTNAPSARASVLPSTLLMERYDEIVRGVEPTESQICFVGGLEWAPNEAGLRWFVREVFPRVLALNPAVRLAVLARGAADRAWVRDHPAVRLVPAETSAAKLFASSNVSIAPLLQGGGVRIKIPESLALGCPVVATSVGAEGHTLPGLTTTNDPAAFAEACARNASQRLGVDERRALRDTVAAVHDAHSLARRLASWWLEAISARNNGSRTHDAGSLHTSGT